MGEVVGEGGDKIERMQEIEVKFLNIDPETIEAKIFGGRKSEGIRPTGNTELKKKTTAC